jgi:hypothetical protein
VVRCSGNGSDAITIRRGDSIVVALEQFAKAEHRYPDSLQELIPRYLGSLPSPGPGYQYWRLWRPVPGDTAYLALREGAGRRGLSLDSMLPAWDLTACTDAVTTCSRALYRSSRNPTWIYEN